MLEAESHINPVPALHSLALSPQTQVFDEACGAEPSGWSHARAATAHRQYRLLAPHAFGEAVSVLNITEDPLLTE